MALPVGVTTATCTVGVPVSFTGAANIRANVSVKPSVFLVHAETGTPLVDMLETIDTTDGVAGQFTLPHTDQAGFVDENQNTYTNWFYTVTIQYSNEQHVMLPKTKVFQLTTGQTLVDLDKLPSGVPALPYTAPAAKVDAFNGRTGAVTLQEGDLPARLAETALNATFVPKWKANTAYLAGDAVLTPAGDTVTAKVNFTSGASYSAANWNYSPTYASVIGAVPQAPNNLTVVLGDSHTDQNHIEQVAPSISGRDFDSYHLWAAALLNGRMRVVKNAGIAGQTSTQILARVNADVLAKLPNGGTCLILWGTNDAGNAGQTTADMMTVFKANTRALIAALLPAKIVPIFITIPPRGNGTTAATTLEKEKTATINRWLLAYCASVGIRCIDTRPLITENVAGNWINNYSDVPGIHALPRANAILGKFIADQLTSYFPPTLPYQLASNVDPTNSVSNGLFLNVTSNLPAGWSIADAGAGATTTVVPVTGFRGNALTMTGAAPADQAIYSSPNLTGITIGDRLAVSYRYTADNLEDAGRYFDIGLRQNGGSYSWLHHLNIEGDTPTGTVPLIYFEAVVPTGTTNIVFQVGTGSTGSAVTTPTVTIGELTITNLTTGQLITP